MGTTIYMTSTTHTYAHTTTTLWNKRTHDYTTTSHTSSIHTSSIHTSSTHTSSKCKITFVLGEFKTAAVAVAVGNANNGVCSRGVAYDAKFGIIGFEDEVCV